MRKRVKYDKLVPSTDNGTGIYALAKTTSSTSSAFRESGRQHHPGRLCRRVRAAAEYCGREAVHTDRRSPRDETPAI